MKNGYTKYQESAGSTVKITIFPSVFEAYKETGGRLSNTNLDSLMMPYVGFSYFYLQLKQKESEHNKLSRNKDVFLQSVKPQTWINLDGVRLEPLLEHHDKMGNDLMNAVYVFDFELFDDSIKPKKLKTDFVFNYIDLAISQDTFKFHFDTTLTNPVPDFKF